MLTPRVSSDEENRFGRRNEGRSSPEYRFVYFIEAPGFAMVKIGCADDPKKRLSQLQVGCPDKLVLRGVYKTDDAQRLEVAYHDRFNLLRERGEWFRIDDDLRALMDDAFDPDDCSGSIDFHPDKHERGLATIHWQPSDTVRAFSDRVCDVAAALGFEVERLPA